MKRVSDSRREQWSEAESRYLGPWRKFEIPPSGRNDIILRIMGRTHDRQALHR